MEPSCGRLREFLSRLASLLGRLRASWNQHMLDFILDTIFEWIFNRFELRKTPPELRKIIKIYWKNSISKRSRSFNVTSLPDRFFEPTWLHVGFQNPRKTLLGAPLETLERTWRRLGASWTHLRAFWETFCPQEHFSGNPPPPPIPPQAPPPRDAYGGITGGLRPH